MCQISLKSITQLILKSLKYLWVKREWSCLDDTVGPAQVVL